MSNYRLNATGLIAEEFVDKNIHFHVFDDGKTEQVWAIATVKYGPSIPVRFISADNDSDVRVRVFGLLNEIPEAQQPLIRAICNEINSEDRYFKFYTDPDSVNIEYDCPIGLSNSCIGPIAGELFARIMHTMDRYYPQLAKALFMEV